MPRRKSVSLKRTNTTRHRRITREPEVRKLIRYLRLQWNKLDRIERGDRLRQLIDRGCSTRGLAEALGVSATTIRRHKTLAELPVQEREAVRAGSSAKKILAQKELADRRRKRQERVTSDERTGELSDRLADTILAFCGIKMKDWLPAWPDLKDFLVRFLSEVRNAAWRFEAEGRRWSKFKKGLSLKQRLQRTRPPVTSDQPLVHLIDWLAILILAEESERSIWERAIEKAGQRAKELRVTKPLVQQYLEEAQRKLEISKGPPPRRY